MSSQQMKPYSCQTHKHKTYRPTPNSYQTPTMPDSIIITTVDSFAFLAIRITTVKTLF